MRFVGGWQKHTNPHSTSRLFGRIGVEKMEFISNSQVGQDTFVYEQLVKPTNYLDGTFLDIGCNMPIQYNNTASLERLGWRGLLVDANLICVNACLQERKNPVICADATKVDWPTACKLYSLGTAIDYLSLDVDDTLGAADSKVLVVLKNLLDAGFTFRAITVEHDRYRVGDHARDSMRELLFPSYTLFAADVSDHGLEFEDWWIRH